VNVGDGHGEIGAFVDDGSDVGIVFGFETAETG
jgi:hypothetical protein